jgi:glucose-1-phosphate cytidylyltransferase
VVHDEVGVFEDAVDGSDHAVLDVGVGGLAEEVAGEHEAGADLGGVEVAGELVAGERRVRADGDGEAEPAGVGVFGAGLGEDQHVGERLERCFQVGEVLLAAGDEVRQLGDLGDAEGGLHVGGLEVVADVGVGVFVVVAAGEGAELPVKTLAAGVVDAGLAPAVASPVAPGIDKDLEGGLVGEDGSAFTHGDVVGGIEGDGGDVAEGADVAAAPGAAEGVATVFNQPQIVGAAEGGDGVEVEDVAEGVGDHDRLDPGGVGGFEEGDVDFVAGEGDLDEDRDEAVLNDGIDGGGEAGGYGDDLVAGLELAVAEFWRAEGAESDQIGGGAGVDEAGAAEAEEAGELLFEFFGETSGGEPGVEGAIDDAGNVVGVDDLAGDWNVGGSGGEIARGEGLGVELAGEVEDLAAKVVCFFRGHPDKNTGWWGRVVSCQFSDVSWKRNGESSMKAVILAGGLGTRLSEETTVRPKPMVEIGGRPILWHILKIYSQHGINDFVICCGYKGYVIKEFFANYFMHMSDVTFDMGTNKMTVHNSVAEPWRVTLVDTGDATGTGGRLRQVRKYLDAGETFCMTYGDGVADVDVGESIKFHKAHGKAVTLTSVQPVARFGALGLKDTQIYSFQEKPADEGGWINGGFFVLEPRAIDAVTDDSQMFEREPIEGLVAENEVHAFFHRGFWQAMDTLRDKQHLDELWRTGKAPWKQW